MPNPGHMSRSTPPLTHSGWMNRPGVVGGRPVEPPLSRGMNDVFVTDNGFRPSGPRFDDYSVGGMPNDRVGFGSRLVRTKKLSSFCNLCILRLIFLWIES